MFTRTLECVHIAVCKRLWADLRSKARLRQRDLIQKQTMDHCSSHNKHLACDTAHRPRSSTGSEPPSAPRTRSHWLLDENEKPRVEKLLREFKPTVMLTKNMFDRTNRQEAGDRNNKCSHESDSKQTFNGLKLQHETHLTQQVSALLCYNNNGSHHTKECNNIKV